MKGTQNKDQTDEPIGIVISRGARTDQAPSVFAYVWALAPEDIDEVLEPQVA